MSRITVLDHGYVDLVETWGSDERIIEAARMSTNKGFEGWGPVHAPDCASLRPTGGRSGGGIPSPIHIPQCTCTPKSGDEKLLRYLYDHKHHTPFEMAGMIVEVSAPIFVFREWHRHRTQSYNEMSARYTPLPDENYIPTVERLLTNSSYNKQAGRVANSDDPTPCIAEGFRRDLERVYRKAQELYEDALRAGIPKELARLCLPVARYSRMRASANLRNWLAFLTLRMDKHAQWEIRQYANAVGGLIAQNFPRTWELFLGDEGHTWGKGD